MTPKSTRHSIPALAKSKGKRFYTKKRMWVISFYKHWSISNLAIGLAPLSPNYNDRENSLDRIEARNQKVNLTLSQQKIIKVQETKLNT